MANGHDYRMLDGIAWAELDGQKVEVSVSANWLQFRTKDGEMVTFGQRKRGPSGKQQPRQEPEGEMRAVVPEGEPGAGEHDG